MILNILYYGLIFSVAFFLMSLGYKIDFEIKKEAAKQALIEYNQEQKLNVKVGEDN